MKTARERSHRSTWYLRILLSLTILTAGFIADGRDAWADQDPPREVENCSWGGVKCCFTDLCECCSRGGKGDGKLSDEKNCQFMKVVPRDLPLSGYLASQECLANMGPWSEEKLRECQRVLKWLELENEGDLVDIEYSYLKCDNAAPYLVITRDERSRAEQTSWGSVKRLYR